MIETALILAGGLGTRLRPLTDSIPKPLLPLKGKPILEHVIENLKRHDVKHIVLSIGYKAEQIQEYFKDGKKLGIQLRYALESESLGTGGAIKKALQGTHQPVFIIWGDNLMDIDYGELQETYDKHRTPVTMALTSREDVENFGVAKLDGEKIVSFVEKPSREKAPSNLINAGAIILEPTALSILPDGKSSIERDLYEKLPPGTITAYIHNGQWFPTDTMEKYRQACQHFLPAIDFRKKRVIIADVDETICESCQQISPEMAAQVDRLVRKGHTFAFISGTHAEELQRMISSRLQEEHHLLATTGTRYVRVQGNSLQERYNHQFTDGEKKEILAAFEKLIENFAIRSLTTKEDQLQDRQSQITFSALGRNALAERKKTFDPDGEKRKSWMPFLRQYLAEEKYDIKIGGTTSLDVTRKGLDKEWGIREFARHNDIPLKNILFFGDKIYPGGNDYAASKIVDCVVVKSPLDTLQKLRELERTPLVDERPWGRFEQFTTQEPSTVKILTINPNKRLSLQSHNNREEFWTALNDGAQVEIDGIKKNLQRGESIFVPKGAKHRLSAGANEVRILEISFGEFDENDIERYEDDFGRA